MSKLACRTLFHEKPELSEKSFWIYPRVAFGGPVDGPMVEVPCSRSREVRLGKGTSKGSSRE